MIRFIRISVILCLLTACVHTPTYLGQTPNWTSFKQRTQELSSHDDWQLQGRVSVQTDQQAITMHVLWKQQGDNYQIHLTHILGSMIAQISQQDGKGVLLLADGRRLEGDDPELLLEKMLGWQIPIRALSFWLRGVLSSDTEHKQAVIDADGLLRRVKQKDIEVSVLSYQTVKSATLLLPKRIDILGDRGKLKWIVTQWRSGNRSQETEDRL